MQPLAITATVIVPDDDDFEITPANGYVIVAAGPGPRAWIRNTVAGPFTHGRYLVSRTLEQGEAPLTVRVVGADVTQVALRMALLVSALEQFTFTLRLTIDGEVSEWACEGADSVPGDGGALDDELLGNYQQLVTFRIPRHPIPLVGNL